jgi:hypothetical protein
MLRRIATGARAIRLGIVMSGSFWRKAIVEA